MIYIHIYIHKYKRAMLFTCTRTHVSFLSSLYIHETINVVPVSLTASPPCVCVWGYESESECVCVFVDTFSHSLLAALVSSVCVTPTNTPGHQQYVCSFAATSDPTGMCVCASLIVCVYNIYVCTVYILHAHSIHLYTHYTIYIYTHTTL